MNCAHCGTLSAASANFCAGCGKPVLSTPGERMEPTLDTRPSASMPPLSRAQAADDQRELYMLAIGDKNRDYYLRRFEEFDKEGTKFGWHWPAFFCTFWWLMYRKMWGKAALYFFLPNVIAVVIGASAAVAPGFAALAYCAYLLALFVIPPLISNGGYYRHCQKVIASARNTSNNPQVQFAVLAKKGGTSNVALVLLMVMAIVAGIGILAAIALPAYQDYTTRAKAVNALRYGKAAAAAVGQHYESHRALPRSLGAVQFGPPLPPELQDVQLNSSDGTIRLVLSGGPVNGRTFQLVPAADTSGRVTWKCQAVDIKERLLPAECRR